MRWFVTVSENGNGRFVYDVILPRFGKPLTTGINYEVKLNFLISSVSDNKVGILAFSILLNFKNILTSLDQWETFRILKEKKSVEIMNRNVCRRFLWIASPKKCVFKIQENRTTKKHYIYQT